MKFRGFEIWKKSIRFHFVHFSDFFPLFPLFFVPILGDALQTILIQQVYRGNVLSVKQSLSKSFKIIHPLFSMKLYFEFVAFLWSFIPIYGIIQGVKHRQYWAMASNVIVFEGLSGQAGRERCCKLIETSPAGVGVRTLVTIPALLVVGYLLAWLFAGSIQEAFYSYGFWALFLFAYWLAVPISGAVNTFYYLSIRDGEKKEYINDHKETISAISPR
jgi:hypothetical protein